MEQPLKERLVGAAVLVGLAVLLIPELLSGRKPSAADPAVAADGTRRYTIELQPPDQSVRAGAALPAELPAPAARPALQLPAPSDETVPAGTVGANPAATSVAATPVLAEPPPEPSPAPRPASSPAPAASAAPPDRTSVPDAADEPAPRAEPGGLAVQVGAFGSEDKARKVVRELQSKGFDAYLSPVERDGKTLQRVRVGPARDAAAAAATAERLKQQGYASAVVVGT